VKRQEKKVRRTNYKQKQLRTYAEFSIIKTSEESQHVLLFESKGAILVL
jgi:hypothetical protein